MQQQQWLLQGQPTSVRCPECRQCKLRQLPCPACGRQVLHCRRCDQRFCYHKSRGTRWFDPHFDCVDSLGNAKNQVYMY